MNVLIINEVNNATTFVYNLQSTTLTPLNYIYKNGRPFQYLSTKRYRSTSSYSIKFTGLIEHKISFHCIGLMVFSSHLSPVLLLLWWHYFALSQFHVEAQSLCFCLFPLSLNGFHRDSSWHHENPEAYQGCSPSMVDLPWYVSIKYLDVRHNECNFNCLMISISEKEDNFEISAKNRMAISW